MDTAIAILVILVLTEVLIRPRIDFLKDNNIIVWYGHDNNRQKLILKKWVRKS